LKKLSLLIAVLAVLISTSTFAQPQVTVHVTGGYNLPLPDLKGDYPADTNSYLQKSGFNAGADVKYFLGKKRNVGITLSLGYNSFSSGDITATGSDTSFFTTAKNKINTFTAGLGIEYAFSPKSKANPFIGVELTGNFFSGDFTSTKGTVSTTSTLKSASRFGVATNLGLDVNLNKSIGFVVGLKYNLANLIGKDSTGGSATEFGLNDKEIGTVSAKNISWLSIYGGFSFYFNRPTAIKK